MLGYFWRTSLRCGQCGRILIGPLGCMLRLVRVTLAIRSTRRGIKETKTFFDINFTKFGK